MTLIKPEGSWFSSKLNIYYKKYFLTSLLIQALLDSSLKTISNLFRDWNSVG